MKKGEILPQLFRPQLTRVALVSQLSNTSENQNKFDDWRSMFASNLVQLGTLNSENCSGERAAEKGAEPINESL